MKVKPESRIEVKKLASLVKLRLSEREEKAFTSQLARILDFFDQLDSAPIEDVEPMFHPVEIFNVLREDEPREPKGDEMLKLPPRVKDRYVWAPRM